MPSYETLASERGIRVAVIGQAGFIAAIPIALLGAITDSAIGFVGLMAELAGIVLSVVGFLLMRRAHGGTWIAAAVMLLAGVSALLIAFAIIPGDRFFGKLGAIIVGFGLYAFANAVAHLLAGLALVTSPVRIGAGLGVVACQLAVIILGALAYFGQLEAASYIALASALAGHIVLLIALVSLLRRVSPAR